MITGQEKTSPEQAPEAPDAESRHTPAVTPQQDVLVTLQRIDRALDEIRSAVDTATRERQHKEFAALPLLAAVLQVVVVGLLALAALDWLFGSSGNALLVKLAFAAVLQLATLTAVACWRRGGA